MCEGGGVSGERRVDRDKRENDVKGEREGKEDVERKKEGENVSVTSVTVK